MRSTGFAKLMGAAGLALGLPWLLALSSTAGSAQQAPKKAPGAQKVGDLDPRATGSSKHFRIALEALKNNDLSIALSELNSAAEKSPTRGMQ